MAYEKHVWQTNEIITADKLNHIEDELERNGSEGTESSYLGVKITMTMNSGKQSMLTNRTAREVVSAIEGGDVISIYMYMTPGESLFTCMDMVGWIVANHGQGGYTLNVTPPGASESITLVANSLDDYFVYPTTESADPSEPNPKYEN